MRSTILAAAIGCMSFGIAFADDKQVDTSKAMLPAGVTPKTLNDQEDIRNTLAEAANAAVTKGGFDDMVERLSSADRKRMGDFANREFAELDGRIEQIRKNWEQKYGSSFNLDNDELFSGFVTVMEGEITDANSARTGWPVPARATRDTAVNTADTVDYLENGRNVAIVKVPASHDLKGITVSMLHEPVDDWRIDLPDNVTGQKIHDNIKTALTNLGDNVAAWPADQNEAYRVFAHRILLALYDVPSTGDPKSASLDRD